MYERFSQLYDTFMADVDYGAWAKYLCELYARAGKTAGEAAVSTRRSRGRSTAALRLFDAACGTGGVTIPLAKAGFSVTGSDLSEEMLRIAADKARRAGVSVPFVQQNLKELTVPRAADIVNCSCDGVNYLLTEEEVKACFCSVFASLKSGGIFCFDVSSRYKLERILADNIFGENSEKAAYLWRNAYDEEQRLLEMELTFFLSEDAKLFERFEERHIQRAHTEEELKQWLSDCGFEDVEVFEAFSFESPKENSERLQFLARKA